MALIVQMRGVVVNVFEVVLNVPVIYRVWNCNSHDFALLHKCFRFRVIDKRAHYFCLLNDVVWCLVRTCKREPTIGSLGVYGVNDSVVFFVPDLACIRGIKV